MVEESAVEEVGREVERVAEGSLVVVDVLLVLEKSVCCRLSRCFPCGGPGEEERVEHVR